MVGSQVQALRVGAFFFVCSSILIFPRLDLDVKILALNSSHSFSSLESLWSDRVYCSLESIRLPLGQSHSRRLDLQGNGSLGSCLHCRCIAQPDNAGNIVKCFLHDCPFKCSHVTNPFQDVHPCCQVCGVFEEANSAASDPAPPVSISPSVPVTSEIMPRQFLHWPPDGSAVSRLALVGVMSPPGNWLRRRHMRQLYSSALAAAGVQMVFVLARHDPAAALSPLNSVPSGTAPQSDDDYDDQHEDPAAPSASPQQGVGVRQVQLQVDSEAAEHADILQSDTVEHYHHLTLKTLSLLQFAASATRPRQLLKTDDDVAIDVRQLVRQLQLLANQSGVHGADCGSCAVGRDPLSWRVSGAEWPWPRFPRFVLGPGYLISGQWLRPLLQRALATRYLHLEDVFVTGVVAEAVGAPRHLWPAGLCTNPLPGGPEGGSGGVDLCRLGWCALTHRVDHVAAARRLWLFQSARARLPVDLLCALNGTQLM